MKIKLSKPTFIKGFKIAFGASAAVFLSHMLGLEFAASAGIITLLTVLDTKVATFLLTIQRILSFILSMTTALIVTHFIHTGVLGYFIYLIILVEFSYMLKWDSSISTNAVFGTHIFVSSDIPYLSYDLIMNELGLLIIGTSIAIIMNLKMYSMDKELINAMAYLEKEIKHIFAQGVHSIKNETEHRRLVIDTERVISSLDKAINTAVKNLLNSYGNESKFYVKYFEMRRSQCLILRQLMRSFAAINTLPKDAEPAIDYLTNLSENLSVKSNAEGMLTELKHLLDEYKTYPLPSTREEFEARANMFHILTEVKEFIELKRDFDRSLTHEQLGIYYSIDL